jgi:hypothetical protein
MFIVNRIKRGKFLKEAAAWALGYIARHNAGMVVLQFLCLVL